MSPASKRAGLWATVGRGSGETKTESSEVMAKEEVAAIVFFGKLTLNGWLPRLGTLTRTVDGLGRRAESITEANLYGAGLREALRIERTVLRGCASLELAGGSTFRTTGPIAPLGSELTSGLTGGLDSIVGDESESVERVSAEYSGPRAVSSDFSSEGVASPGLLACAEASELATGGGGVRGVDSTAGAG